MPNYRNKSKIVKREELVPPGKLEEGMIISFRYNTGSDKTPVVLVLYYDRKKKFIEGINLNYITISRVGRLVELMSDAKVSIDKDEFRDITFKLKQQGVTVIGADSQLTENNIMKLVNLVPLKEALQVTTNNGKVAIISDPEDIKTFNKGGTVFGDDNDGNSIELSKEDSLDFQSITQEGSCGYAPEGEDPNEADQPAGSHLLRRKIREIIESFADDPNVPGVTGMEDAGGKVRDNMLAVIPDNYGYKDLAKDIAFIVQDAYGSHNIKPFMEELSQKFQRPNY